MEDAAAPPPPGMAAKLSQHGSGPGPGPSPSPRSTSSELMANVGGGVRVDEDECRICRGPGEAGNHLRYPCACRGTIKYVHQDCLLQWLNRRKISRCEVCKHEFSYAPVYAMNAPARLPPQEFVLGLAARGFRLLRILQHLVYLLFVWLLVIPFVTHWIWEFAFFKGFSEVRSLFTSRLTVSTIFADCVHGSLLSLGMAYIFLGIAFIRLSFLQEPIGAPGLANRIIVGNENGENAGRRQGFAEVLQFIKRVVAFLADWWKLLVARIMIYLGIVEFVPLNDLVNMQVAFNEIAFAVSICSSLILPFPLLYLSSALLSCLMAFISGILKVFEPAVFLKCLFFLLDISFSALSQSGLVIFVHSSVSQKYSNDNNVAKVCNGSLEHNRNRMVVASNLAFIVVLVLLPFCVGRTATCLQYWFFTHNTAQMSSSVVSMIELTLLSVNTKAKDALKAITYFALSHHGASMPSQVLKGDSEIIKMDKASNSVSGLVSAGLFNEQLDGTPVLSDDATLFIGYMVLLSFVFLHLGTVCMMRYARGEPLTLQRLSGVALKIDAIRSFVRRFFTLFWQVMTMVSRNFLAISKVSVILGAKFGIFPLMCGWWLDVCTLRIFGQTVSGRVAFSVKNPILMSLAYWIVGICYLTYIFIHVSLIKEVLRNGVFYFFPDVANPDNFIGRMIECPVFKHARGFLLLVGVHGSLIVMLVFLPIKLVNLYAPSVFPLNLFNSEAKTVAAFSLRRCLFHFGVPCTIRFYYPSATFKVVLRMWLTVVCSLLGLNEILLPRHEDNDGDVEPLRQRRIRNVSVVAIIEGSVVGLHTPGNTDAAEVDTGDVGQEADSRFVLRILILLVLAWMTALVFNSLMMAIPILLGRTLFQAASHLLLSHGFKYDDFCSFIVGSCMMRAVIFCAKHAVEHVQTRGIGALLSQIWHSCMNAFKMCAVVSSWIFVIPVVIGLLLDVVMVVPVRLPLGEGSVITWFQRWILGLLFLITLFGLVMVDNVHSVDERWLVKLQLVLNGGLAHQPALLVLKEILVPTTMRLLIALCTPYMLVRLASTILGYPSPLNSAIHRFFWPGCFAFSIIWFCLKIIYACVIYLHNRIRDDRYCVGKRLRDYGEDTREAK